MSKTTAFSGALLELLFLNRAGLTIGDELGLRGSIRAGQFWLSLHSQDPGSTATQITAEVRYGGYGRVPVDRSADFWKVEGRKAILLQPVDFPEMTSGAALAAKFVGLGTAENGGGLLIYRARLDPEIVLASGVIPRLRKDTTEFGED
jgi:hypothetical protein